MAVLVLAPGCPKLRPWLLLTVSVDDSRQSQASRPPCEPRLLMEVEAPVTADRGWRWRVRVVVVGGGVEVKGLERWG